jgi:hypothetical protein
MQREGGAMMTDVVTDNGSKADRGKVGGANGDNAGKGKASKIRTGWFKFGITSILAVGALVAGFIQFGTTNAFSIREPFLKKQTELCVSAAEHAARLASSRDMDTWKKSREEFWMLYWGPLAIVEDVESQTKNRVEAAMVVYGRELQKVDPTSPLLPVNALQQPALDVAHACRDLLSSKWNFGVLKWFGQ